MIYLDYAATSLKRKELLKFIYENSEIFDGNPESLHAYGRKAKKILNESRKFLADTVGAYPDQIIFTSGASEANNTIISQFEKNSIIISPYEHDSIYKSAILKNAVISEADCSGIADIEDIKQKIDDNTKLVALCAVNNETGAIQKISELGNFLKDKGIRFHVDAVQAYGHMEIDVNEINCTSLSVSGHKLGALNGFGFLYSKKEISPLILGGLQERGKRAGTSFTAGAWSLKEAYAKSVNEREIVSKFKKFFIKKIKEKKIPFEINGDSDFCSDHILNLHLPFSKANFVLTYADMNGLCISSGSACEAGSGEPSRIITAMFDEKRAESSVRFSFGYKSEFEELEKAADILKRLYDEEKNGR